MQMQCFGKTVVQKAKILNLSHQKKNGFRTKLSYCKAFHRVSVVNRNEKDLDNYEQTWLFRTFNTRTNV